MRLGGANEMAKTFIKFSAHDSSVLVASRWLLETATKINDGVAFLPWQAADYEVRNLVYKYGEDADTYWVPFPPKVGIKLVADHRAIQIEDVFHYSVIDFDEYVFSNYNDTQYRFERFGFNNEFVYNVAKALRHLATIVAPDGGPVLLQLQDWNSTALEREILTDWEEQIQNQRRYHRRRRR
jgi:hypothetical protein